MNNNNSASTAKRLPRWILLIGLTVAYSPIYLNQLARWLGADWEWIKGPPSVLIWNWLAVAALFAFIFKVECRALGSIGLKMPGIQDALWAITFWLIATATSGMVNVWLSPAPSDGIKTILALSLPILVFLIFTTSITEEILFRGYAVERLRELTGQMWVSVSVSATLFVLPHVLFFGPSWLLYQGVNALLLYVLYVWRRNLWACMLLHFLGNAMILFPALGLV